MYDTIVKIFYDNSSKVYEVGVGGVKEIIEHKPFGNGGASYYIIYFNNGTSVNLLNVDDIYWKKNRS